MSEPLVLLIVIVALVALIVALNARQVTVIYPPNVGLLYRNGQFQRELGPGRYAFFDPLKRTRVVEIAKAPLPAMLGDVTVLSKDQFAFRITISPVIEVVDARAFSESQPIIEPFAFSRFVPQATSHAALHSLAASAALEVVAGYTLREMFADQALITAGIQARLASAIPGAAIERVLLTSITLPPETRKMFTEVERSKLEAEASLERARGEQASLRALANAARLIKDNPALANLRFLQTLEQAPGAKTIVIGGAAVPLSFGDGGPS